MFFSHYGTKKQFGGSKRSTLPINILKRGSITYFQLILPNIKIFMTFVSDIVEIFFRVFMNLTIRKRIKFKHSLKLLTSKEVKLF